MLAFTNEQTEQPYNATMRKEKSRLEGIQREASNLLLLIYQFVRKDIMAYTVPCSVTLEKVNLLMPEAITTIESTITTISKLHREVRDKQRDTLLRKELFPTLNDIMPKLIRNANCRLTWR